jgi:hypothetical protein
MLATFWAALLYSLGKTLCVMWSTAFGEKPLLIFVDRFVVAVPPALLLLFPPFVHNNYLPTLGVAEFALLVLLCDFFSLMHSLIKTVSAGRLEVSFQEIGLEYPPKSRIATFIVLVLVFSVAMAVSYLVSTKM